LTINGEINQASPRKKKEMRNRRQKKTPEKVYAHYRLRKTGKGQSGRESDEGGKG